MTHHQAAGFDALMTEVLAGSGGRFGHRQHVQLTWLAVRRYGMPAAIRLVSDGIRRTARYAGAPQKYHETITVAWMKLLAAAGERVGQTVAFDELLRLAPELGDKDLPLRYYTRDRLFSDAARGAWVPPDSPF